MEAVKQGSASVGLCSNTHVVLAAIKRSTGDLASYQKKIVEIDDHVAIAISGLTSDARQLTKMMQSESLASKISIGRPLSVARLVGKISYHAQLRTFVSHMRPFGVGLLVGGVDEAGTHLFEFSPSGTALEYQAMAIGSRSQSARTYLERCLPGLEKATPDTLIRYALKALSGCLPQGISLTTLNCSVCVIGGEEKLRLLEGDAVGEFLPPSVMEQ